MHDQYATYCFGVVSATSGYTFTTTLIVDEDRYAEFCRRIQQANAEGELYAVAAWRHHIEVGREWKASRDWLARRWPERWASRHYIKIQVDKEIEGMLRELKDRLRPQDFA